MTLNHDESLRGLNLRYQTEPIIRIESPRGKAERWPQEFY